MALLFKTRDESSVQVDITGVGLLPANGQGGIPVERAAAKMPELQKDGEPLTGAELKEAATLLATERGFEITETTKTAIQEIESEGEGALPDVLEASKRAYRDVYGDQAPPEASGVAEEETKSEPKASSSRGQEPKKEAE